MVPYDPPVGTDSEEKSVASPMEESFVRFKGPFDKEPFSSIAERGIGTLLTVAEFVISAFAYIKRDRSVPGSDEFALAVAEGVAPRVPPRAPVVFLASV